jgi:hypothetical protein
MPWLPPSMGHVAVGGQQQQARVRAAAIEALQAIAQDSELLKRSAELAREAAAGTLAPEEAARQMSQDSPELASLLDRVPGQLKKAVIAVLIQAIFFVAEHYIERAWDPSATPADVERIVTQHDREKQREIQRDRQREIEDAVEQALRDYQRQHPPTEER